MRAELKKKSTRTVHEKKVTRVVLDIPYDEAKMAEDKDQDFLSYLDANVGSRVSVTVGPFGAEGHQHITDEVENSQSNGEERGDDDFFPADPMYDQ